MKVYKGTDKDIKCNGFQFTPGVTAEFDGEPKLCEQGFHACESPLDVLGYYPPTDSRYFEAELDGVTDERDDDSKRVGKKITLGAEIGIPGLVKAHVEYVKEAIKQNNSGNGAQIGSSGYGAQIGSSGDRAKIGSSGDRAKIGSSGYGAQIGSSGDRAKIGSSGDRAKIGSSG
ncbi:MAG: hypothetical protein IJK23_02540, partial [Clostridia bacterium]|nr:hypothetical protein [Clostridia bacterium]